uniref:Transmembrane protein n=1 Tax=Medicago truncatula TaxID=3880 RepID=I3SYC9_MEDTR|nr:unknown [Medicago truncatula]
MSLVICLCLLSLSLSLFQFSVCLSAICIVLYLKGDNGAMAEVVELASCKCMVGKVVCNCNRSLMVATLPWIPLFSLSLRFFV